MAVPSKSRRARSNAQALRPLQSANTQFRRTIKTPGVVQLDERRIVVVSPRFDGYVETVGPVTTGTHVKKGDVLAKVFGQEVLNEAARLLIEQNSGWSRDDEAITPSGPKSPSGAVVGATRRLQNLGVPDEFMQRVKHERRVPDTLEYRSPIDGEVIERNWSDGQGFKAGDVAFKIADHSIVWMMADVAEGDIAAVRTGQKVSITTRAHPGRTFSGTVAVVYPHLMKETRTVRVRIELPNPDLALLPDMYGDVEIATGADQDVIAVPASAIIDSGSRQVVLLDLGDGRFEPREIKAGRRGDDFVEVVSGVAEGDKVVVNGNFLIDAESNLQSALKGSCQPRDDGRQPMIARLIGWSAKNLMLVLIATAFAVVAGIWAVRTLPLDAIPDLSDTQVIVYTEFPGQAPQVVEDQVTFPLTTSMLTVPRSKVVRGFSFFGVSFVYIIFEDGTDIYWARSRVLEYLNAAAKKLPAGVTPTLGPDATGVGWVYQYAVVGKNKSLAALRSLQDWDIRFGLSKAEGVAEVASVGGFVKQYAVVVDPGRLRTLDIPLAKVRDVIRGSNMDVGGRTLELSEHEFMVRGRGYLKGIDDIENIVVKSGGGTPVLLKDVARVELAGDERRGIAELNGDGEVASGIALQRFGANALTVIDNIKERLKEIMPSLPEGTEIVPVYDRSELIHRAIATLRSTLFEESLVVALVCIVFLLHVRSALVAILMLPVGILMAFVAMKLLGIGSNIMSLGGIAIAIGAMIDAAIVMIENAHKHLERAPPGQAAHEILIEAAAEVGPALFFSLLVITVSFLPIFTLESQEGRLFGPLAFTKTFAMAAAAVLSVTLVPALMIIFVRGRIIPEAKNPLNRALIAIYRPVIRTVLKAKTLTIAVAVFILAVSVWPVTQVGSEFMPNLNEGTLLYMPTTLPGLSVTKSAELLQTQDRIIKSFPEVASVYGKAGRAETATDPAPLEMFETVINLKPKEEWRPGLTLDGLIAEMDKALQFPGVSNAWTMPIKARIDMLSTGIRTPVGIKIIGKDLAAMEKVAREVETVLKAVPGTSSAYAERVRRWLLPRNHSQPRAAGPLRAHDLRRAGRRGDGTRCPTHHHHGRGAGTLHGRHSLSAGLAI